MTAARASVELDRAALDELYGAYADCLDEDDLEAWLQLFAEDCEYRAVSRENWSRNLPLSTMWCETRGMLEDRVRAVRQTSMFIPRVTRHLIGRPRVAVEASPADTSIGGGSWAVEASFVVVQTLAQQPTEMLAAGRYYDLVVDRGKGLRFAAKIAVYDSDLIPNSLVYPL